jgi:DNA-binding NarL/FixJ family response regulator
MPMRILVADEQPKVRFALRILLEQQAGFEIVGETKNAEELLAQTAAKFPEVVLLGWDFPGLEADTLMFALREINPNLWVIALSGLPEARLAAMDAGANAFVSKADPPESLLKAIKEYDCS